MKTSAFDAVDGSPRYVSAMDVGMAEAFLIRNSDRKQQKSASGFNVVLTPPSGTATLAAGPFDVLVIG